MAGVGTVVLHMAQIHPVFVNKLLLEDNMFID